MPAPQEPQQQAPMEMTSTSAPGIVTQQPTTEPQPDMSLRGGEEAGRRNGQAPSPPPPSPTPTLRPGKYRNPSTLFPLRLKSAPSTSYTKPEEPKKRKKILEIDVSRSDISDKGLSSHPKINTQSANESTWYSLSAEEDQRISGSSSSSGKGTAKAKTKTKSKRASWPNTSGNKAKVESKDILDGNLEIQQGESKQDKGNGKGEAKVGLGHADKSCLDDGNVHDHRTIPTRRESLLPLICPVIHEDPEEE
ncbi:hypothetical protein RRF57_007364 [Xylaria bambusicola]|uniref:Uncharacterized protein n=1 Tax=Xylaria bambusicola TaxID=326684 RepID=A0AAN7UG26_9PEZI